MGWQFDIQRKKKKTTMLKSFGLPQGNSKNVQDWASHTSGYFQIFLSFFLTELDPLNTQVFCIYHPCISFRDCSKLLGYKPEHQLQEMQVSDMLWYIVLWAVLSDCDSHTPCCSSGKMLPALTWTGSTGCTMPAVSSWAGFSLHLWNRWWWAGSGGEKNTIH